MVSYTFLVVTILLLPIIAQAQPRKNLRPQTKLRGYGGSLSTKKVVKEEEGLPRKMTDQIIDNIDGLERSRRKKARRLSKSGGGYEADDCGKKQGKKGEPGEEPDDCGGDTTRIDDFSFVPLPTGTLTGHVYEDLNGNGVKDDGEPGIPNAKVVLRDSMGEEINSVDTDANGNYTVIVPSDTIFIEVSTSTLPPNSKQTDGDNPTAIYIAPGSSVHTVDGFQQQVLLQGLVYFDEDGDGNQAGTEDGLHGVTVDIFDVTGGLLESVVTDADGNYSVWLPPGSVRAVVDESTLPFIQERHTQGQGNGVTLLSPGSVTQIIDGFYVGPKSNDDEDAKIQLNEDILQFFNGP